MVEMLFLPVAMLFLAGIGVLEWFELRRKSVLTMCLLGIISAGVMMLSEGMLQLTADLVLVVAMFVAMGGVYFPYTRDPIGFERLVAARREKTEGERRS